MHYTIGLDVGGTKIAGGLLDASGQLIARERVLTPVQQGGAAVLSACVALAEQLRDAAGDVPITGIGIGVCELVGLDGRATSAYNFDWRDLDVPPALAHIGPTVVDSDVRSAALAEARYGAGRPYDLFAYITVGTGISYTLVPDGIPFRGARGNALLLASMPLTLRCDACGHEVNQVLEEYAGGPGLQARYNAQTGAQLTSGQQLMAAVNGGDPIARDVVESAAASLGSSVGLLVNLLDPQALVIGGGLGLAGGLYWESFVQSTRAHIYADDTRQLPILPAELGVDAGVIGAALLIGNTGLGIRD
ncbi:MAG: ROK family protein [Caldilineaceae bacterium]